MHHICFVILTTLCLLSSPLLLLFFFFPSPPPPYRTMLMTRMLMRVLQVVQLQLGCLTTLSVCVSCAASGSLSPDDVITAEHVEWWVWLTGVVRVCLKVFRLAYAVDSYYKQRYCLCLINMTSKVHCKTITVSHTLDSCQHSLSYAVDMVSTLSA